MDYTKIHIAKKVLEVAGLPIPDDEKEIRKKAYECLINKDFLAAHQIRLGKNWPSFTKGDWEDVIRISGKDQVEDNMAAFTACLRHGLV